MSNEEGGVTEGRPETLLEFLERYRRYLNGEITHEQLHNRNLPSELKVELGGRGE